MKSLMDIHVLNCVGVGSFVAALALTTFAFLKDRGRNLAYAALIVGFVASTIGALQSWNGHDWIPDGDGSMRCFGAACGFISLFALCWFLGERTAKTANGAVEKAGSKGR